MQSKNRSFHEKPEGASKRLSASENAPQHWDVTDERAGQRLDNLLLRELKGVPRSRIYHLIRKGQVRVNGKRAKPGHKLEISDRIRIPPLRTASERAPAKPSKRLSELLQQSILYQDQHLLVMNKPCGLPVHGGTGVEIGLIEAMRQLLPEKSSLELVHRLDRGTSGCLMLAKHPSAAKNLGKLFKGQEVQKIYRLIVSGAWPEELTEVGAALGKNRPRGGERMVEASKAGKAALTRFRLLASRAHASLLEARPLTGRTHQIRVHASLAGHPVLGDEKYADRAAADEFRKMPVKRLCLHAMEIGFTHPETNKFIEISANYDKKFTNILKFFGMNSF